MMDLKIGSQDCPGDCFAISEYARWHRKLKPALAKAQDMDPETSRFAPFIPRLVKTLNRAA